MNRESTVERRIFLKTAFSLFRKGRNRERWLRPPGAVREPLFLALCKGCGDCINACTHQSIKLINKKAGTPIIIPKESPCYLCEDFPCINACQNGALRPVGSKDKVKMGIASLKKKDCLAWDGGSCQLCVIRCPLSGEAIYLDDFRPIIKEGRCVGCGVCEQACFTVNDRASITVIPYWTNIV